MRVVYLSLIGCVCIFAGCNKPYNPFRIEKEQLRQQVATIGIMPIIIQVEDDLEDPNNKRDIFTRYIEKKLQEKGFKIVPASEYKAIYDSLKTTLGPVYDPYTGKANKEIMKTVCEHARREYLAKYPVDAFLRPLVFVTKVNWHLNQAKWHGVTESTTGKEGFWANFNAPNASGTMAGLSLSLVIQNPQDETYYINFGGIQLLSHVQNNMEFVAIPESQLLASEEKIRRSVDVALEPLLSDEEKK